jgi:hypothetical protein
LPNFEPNKITRLYQECILAARGSRWVWALTFASSIEGLATILIRYDPEPSAEEAAAIALEERAVKEFIKVLEDGHGDNRLKRIATGALRRSVSMTTIRALRRMVAAGVIEAGQLSAWQTIRPAVSHGSLISPYSTQEEDEKLLALVEMMHALTRELLRRIATIN